MLSIEEMSISYGPAKALFDVSIGVSEGQVLAILGPNGAGKSSLAKAVAGEVFPTQGRIFFGGKDVTKLSAHQMSRAGVAYLPEGSGVFRELSVVDNLRMFLRRGCSRKACGEHIERVFELFPELAAHKHQRGGTLSGGEQQMLSLAPALVQPPKLIIVDEPSLGLAPLLIDRVFETLEIARNEGVTIVLIEQYVHRALAFATQCAILQRGQLRWSGPTSGAHEEIMTHYFGITEEMAG